MRHTNLKVQLLVCVIERGHLREHCTINKQFDFNLRPHHFEISLEMFYTNIVLRTAAA